ncbi:hypothetical protein [Solidesulfovibrio sp.]|uniref:hypothetical protein n=1 Tax=Solidesulfovibrio sp. TaxID=2910990 RepID=UPI00262B52D8|nr:hypothetical protein [Solidesulfovibrio sp.]
MNASFLGTNAFAVGGDRTDALQPGVRVLADCGADGARYATVSAASFDAGADRTTATLAMDADGLTANLAAVLHGNDVPASLPNHGHAGPADGGAVAHGALSGVGTHSHAAIDAFMAGKGVAFGLATLDANTLVVQNPANATATPGGTRIVVSDPSGTVDSWVSDATTSVKGKVQLATATETVAGSLAAKAVTPAGLAASAKGLLSANTTIYVATTGSDATGDGSSSAPFASIAQALASIKNKLIASGVTMTIQVADGTYSVSSTINIDHPDADKIQIRGNTAAETKVALSAIDATARTITVAGNYFSNADAPKNIAVGDVIGLTGSSTSELNGAYVVSGVSYDGANTIITCSSETFTSSAVGGGNIIIKPSNRVVLNVSGGVNGFTVNRCVKNITGITLRSGGGSSFGVYFPVMAYGNVSSVIFYNWYAGIDAMQSACVIFDTIAVKSCKYGVYSQYRSTVLRAYGTVCIFDSCSYASIMANNASFVLYDPSNTIFRSSASISPAVGQIGNNNSMVAQG